MKRLLTILLLLCLVASDSPAPPIPVCFFQARTAASSDPYFSSVVLLLHCDGANTSVTFTDNSSYARTTTANGNVQQSTAQFKFGSASALLDGTGDYLSYDGSSDFAFGSGDFTIEFWIRPASISGTPTLFDTRPVSLNGAYTVIYLSGGQLRYYAQTSDRITGTTAMTTGTWYHVAVSRTGTSTKMFLNGTQEGSTYTDSNSYVVAASRPRIGENANGGSALNGNLDDIRITKGVARYTSNFSVPTAAFPNN